MSTELPVMTAEFPRAVRGYAVEAVDEFVQEIGERLNALQAELTKQAARGDRLAEEAGLHEEELNSFREKERAVSAAFIAAESFKAKAESDYQATMTRAQSDADELLSSATAAVADAKSEADSLLAKSKTDAEQLKAQARSEADAIKAQARIDAEKTKSQAKTDLENAKSRAQSEADAILAQAYRQAEEMTARANGSVADLEMRIRSLRTEYVETLTFVRSAIESQLAALPPAGEIETFTLPAFSQATEAAA